MRLLSSPRRRAERGFSIAELLVAVTIGLVILAGMSTLFVNNTKAQGEIEKSHRQVENGRFAIQLLAGDLRNAGYLAEFDPTVLAAPPPLPALCADTLDDLRKALPLHVQGVDNAPAGTLACLGDVRANTDVLVVRRTATCVAGQPNCEPLGAGEPFFQASLCNNASELDSDEKSDFYALDTAAAAMTRHKRDCSPTAGSGTLASVRRYLTHVYFIANNSKPGDGIPTLKRAELGAVGGALAFTIVPLVEGIENMQLEYGIDLPRDGVANQFSADPAAGCAAADPDCPMKNWRGVVSVKLNLLARNITPTRGYRDAKSYVLGRNADATLNTIPAAGDEYKRHVFQSLVGLPNPAGRRFP